MGPGDVLDKLIKRAIHRRILIATPDWRVVEDCVRTGKPIPDKCLPGRLLDELSTTEREVLQGLRSSDTENERHPCK